MTRTAQRILTIALLVGSPHVARAQEVVTYYHTDAVGSVRMITDANGEVVARYDFLAFGTDAPTNQSAPDKRMFTGQERDQETGFEYFGARYYHNPTGRFSTPDDPIYMDLFNPQSMNRYAYVLNSPLRWVDPGGHDPQCPTDYCESITVRPPRPPDDIGFQYHEWFDNPFAQMNQQTTLQPLPQTPRLQNKLQTTWHNTCPGKALGYGALQVGVDSLGLIPEFGPVSRAIGNAFDYRGIVADQFGNKVLGAVRMGMGIGFTGTGSFDRSPTASISTGLGVAGIMSTLAGAAPGIGQIISGFSMIVDGYKTSQAVQACR